MQNDQLADEDLSKFICVQTTAVLLGTFKASRVVQNGDLGEFYCMINVYNGTLTLNEYFKYI